MYGIVGGINWNVLWSYDLQYYAKIKRKEKILLDV